MFCSQPNSTSHVASTTSSHHDHASQPINCMPTSSTTCICSICQRFNHRKLGRNCSSCQKYYHISCVKMSKKSSQSLPIWKCDVCISIHQRTPQSASDEEAPDVESVLKQTALLRQSRTIPIKIPKAARITAALSLSNVINVAIDSNTPNNWLKLHSFAVLGLGIISKKGVSSDTSNSSLSTVVKRNLNEFNHCSDIQLSSNHVPKDGKSLTTTPTSTLRKRVNAKLMQGDVSAAVRVVASDDSILRPTNEVLNALQLKHPQAPEDIRNMIPPDCDQIFPITTESITEALRSFPASSSGGVDGLKPGHLKDLLTKSTAEAGLKLMSSIIKFCNCFIQGKLSAFARQLFFAANLIALKKKDGGIRPIAVGNTFRRLAAKLLCHSANASLGPEFAPVQLGVGVKGGCEAAAHAIRQFTSLEESKSTSRGIMIKLDIKNAFNSMRRDHFLETCLVRCPRLYPMAHLAYHSATPLLFGDNIIYSESGVQQGDPMGPVLFSLGIDSIARSSTAAVNVWYLDDATLAGHPNVILQDLKYIVPQLNSIGLELNSIKTEVINIDLSASDFESTTNLIQDFLGQITCTKLDMSTILGSPIANPAIDFVLNNKLISFSSMTEKLKSLDAHPALFLLKSCFALPKLLYTLRSAPCHTFVGLLNQFEAVEKDCAEHICNVKFDDTGWNQATLPIKFGGLGLRTPNDVSTSAYTSSLFSCKKLSNDILSKITELKIDTTIEQVIEDCKLTAPILSSRQSEWDEIRCVSKFKSLLNSLDQHRRATLLAASQPCSGSWLNAIPSAPTGTFLSNDEIQVGSALRLGLQFCEHHKCRCGHIIDRFGLHPLSCLKSAGRFPRHAALNDVIKRCLDLAGFPSILEPAGLDRGDGKRPDGITMFPFKQGKTLVWDATCCDTFSKTNIIRSAQEPGSAANQAEVLKHHKYATLAERHIFQPIAVETSGVIGENSLHFLHHLASLASKSTGNAREGEFLFQRISIAILRGNCLAIRSAGQS